MAEESKGRVCVTGGTGFIGSWIIKTLLEYGYSVNATVRSHPEHKKDVSFLTNLPGASQKLQIINADLNNPESFKDAIEGCMGVFHRVIYTSSAAACYYNSKEDDEVKDESVWSDVDYLRSCEKSGFWNYAISKTLTEKAVLEFGEQNGLDVVTLLPTFVVGPFICPNLPGSVLSSLYFAFGEKETISYLQTPMVHVDDIARAQIFLLEHPNPKGRYNCSACMVTLEKVFQVLSVKYPRFQGPSIDSLRERNLLKFQDLSSKKLMDAGFEFKYGIEEMLEDAIASCKEKGYL
ncbi:hypothetical protein K1719_038043 [Acacia pycnantha]|nr:hypothetical protein K1719_038043 [Acacia pycnantha]